MNSAMLVDFSCLMVTYNGEDSARLQNCLQSIHEQTMRPSEIVLVFDGSLRNELERIVSHFTQLLKIKIIRSKKQGLAKCLNEGLSHVAHDIVIRCDSDDINLKARFENQIRMMINSRLDLVSNGTHEFDEKGIKQKSRLLDEGFITLNSSFSIYRNPVNHNCCCFRRNAVLSSGGYPSGRMEDYRLWLNMLKDKKRLFHSNEILLEAYAGSISNRRIGKDYLSAEVDLFFLKLRIFSLNKSPIIFMTFLMRCFVRLPLINNVLPWLYRNVLRT
jgi:amylovoran biosynthesis glycosyltransferase AmsE